MEDAASVPIVTPVSAKKRKNASDSSPDCHCEDAPCIMDVDDAEGLADTLTIGARNGLTGDLCAEVRLHKSDTVAGLRKAIADTSGQFCSLWLLLGTRLLPDRESLEEAGVDDKCIVEFIRCEPVPTVAPPPAAPQNIEIIVRYALSGAYLDRLSFWPTDSLAALREAVVNRHSWNGPAQLLLPDGQPLLGPINLLEAGLSDGAVITAVQCEPRYLLTASADNTVRFLNADNGMLLMSLENDDWVNSATMSPDGNWVLASLFNSTAQLWNVQTETRGATLSGHTGPVLWGAFSPDSSLAGTASYDHTAKIWNMHDGELLHDLKGHKDGVLCIVFAPQGRQVATASYDRSVKLWSCEAGECLKTLIGHSDEIRSAVFSPEGTCLATASADLMVMLWDVETGVCSRTLSGHRSAVSSVAFSPDGRLLLTGAADQTARLWNLGDGECLLEFAGHDDVVTSAAFSFDGQWIATSSADGTTRVWAIESGDCLATHSGHTAEVTSASFAMKAY